jgi:hypothetical protein
VADAETFIGDGKTTRPPHHHLVSVGLIWDKHIEVVWCVYAKTAGLTYATERVLVIERGGQVKRRNFGGHALLAEPD